MVDNTGWPERRNASGNEQEVRATVRRARQLGDGSWLTVELGSTRTLHGGADEVDYARQLAEQLDAAVIEVITRKHKRHDFDQRDPVVQLEVIEPPVEEPYEPAPICPEHGEAFMTHSKDGRTWMSHPIEGGGWCNAKSFKV